MQVRDKPSQELHGSSRILLKSLARCSTVRNLLFHIMNSASLRDFDNNLEC